MYRIGSIEGLCIIAIVIFLFIKVIQRIIKIDLKKTFTDEKRILIILMAINIFAFFVNYFDLSPVYKNYQGSLNNIPVKYYFFTTKEGLDYGDPSKKFYPFTKFSIDSNREYVFRGIFPDYDQTEFIAYSILIFGIFYIRKAW